MVGGVTKKVAEAWQIFPSHSSIYYSTNQRSTRPSHVSLHYSLPPLPLSLPYRNSFYMNSWGHVALYHNGTLPRLVHINFLPVKIDKVRPPPSQWTHRHDCTPCWRSVKCIIYTTLLALPHYFIPHLKKLFHQKDCPESFGVREQRAFVKIVRSFGALIVSITYYGVPRGERRG